MNNLRPFLQFADTRASEVSPSNPYGFYSDHRRLDTEQGVDLLLSNWCAPAAELGVEGVIFWTPCGWPVRGAQYRPDAHLLPEPVARNWPRLMKGLEQLGMRAGVCVRPQHLIADCGAYDVAVRGSYDKHNTGLADYAGYVTKVWGDRGVRHFYADSFGEFDWHVPILQAMFGAGAEKVWMEASCVETIGAGGSIYCERPRQGSQNTPTLVRIAKDFNPSLDVLCNPRPPHPAHGGTTPTYCDIVRLGYRCLMPDHLIGGKRDSETKADAIEACKLIQAMNKPKADKNETKGPKVVK